MGVSEARAVGREYEGKVATLASKIRRSTPPERRVVSTHTLLVLHRILWILTAMASDNLGIFLLVGCVQFVVAPYSLAVSFMTLGCWRRRDISRGEDVGRVGWNVGFGQMMCGEGWNRPKLGVMQFLTHVLGHLLSALVIHFLPLPDFSLEITYGFNVAFLSLDFLVTAYYALWENSDGRPKHLPLWKELQHMIYGNLGEGELRWLGPYEEEQYHQDHHLHHRANYGFNRPMLDMIFNTYKRTEKEWLDVNHARYKKEILPDGNIVIHMKVDKQPFPELSTEPPVVAPAPTNPLRTWLGLGRAAPVDRNLRLRKKPPVSAPQGRRSKGKLLKSSRTSPSLPLIDVGSDLGGAPFEPGEGTPTSEFPMRQRRSGDRFGSDEWEGAPVKPRPQGLLVTAMRSQEWMSQVA
eukprot:g8547.t1